MNFAYINKKINRFFLISRPKIMPFPSGHSLIIFPDIKKESRLKKALKKHNAILTGPFPSQDFADKIHLKVIKQTIKQLSPQKVIFTFENALNHTQFLQNVINEDIEFYLSNGPGVSEANDYFLEKNGIPIKTTTATPESLTMYFGGKIPVNTTPSSIINFSGTKISGLSVVTEYLISGTSFPLKIETLSLLETALYLTGKDISDVIAKIGIFESFEE